MFRSSIIEYADDAVLIYSNRSHCIPKLNGTKVSKDNASKSYFTFFRNNRTSITTTLSNIIPLKQVMRFKYLGLNINATVHILQNRAIRAKWRLPRQELETTYSFQLFYLMVNRSQGSKQLRPFKISKRK